MGERRDKTIFKIYLFKIKKDMLLLACLVTIGWGQTITWGGSCPTVPLIADFDITKVFILLFGSEQF